jgi:hypothetical protein
MFINMKKLHKIHTGAGACMSRQGMNKIFPIEISADRSFTDIQSIPLELTRDSIQTNIDEYINTLKKAVTSVGQASVTQASVAKIQNAKPLPILQLPDLCIKQIFQALVGNNILTTPEVSMEFVNALASTCKDLANFKRDNIILTKEEKPDPNNLKANIKEFLETIYFQYIIKNFRELGFIIELHTVLQLPYNTYPHSEKCAYLLFPFSLVLEKNRPMDVIYGDENPRYFWESATDFLKTDEMAQFMTEKIIDNLDLKLTKIADLNPNVKPSVTFMISIFDNLGDVDAESLPFNFCSGIPEQYNAFKIIESLIPKISEELFSFGVGQGTSVRHGIRRAQDIISDYKNNLENLEKDPKRIAALLHALDEIRGHKPFLLSNGQTGGNSASKLSKPKTRANAYENRTAQELRELCKKRNIHLKTNKKCDMIALLRAKKK